MEKQKQKSNVPWMAILLLIIIIVSIIFYTPLLKILIPIYTIWCLYILIRDAIAYSKKTTDENLKLSSVVKDAIWMCVGIALSIYAWIFY